jgi:cytochrome P450
MEEQIWFYLLSCSSVFLCFFFYTKIFTKDGNKNVPPSPPSWPVIGHLHLLKIPVHRTLENLSYKYGSIFSLKFGSIPVIVISSPQLLEECLNKNDVVFANRPQDLLVGKHIGYNHTAVSFVNYGPHWRNLRRALNVELLSAHRLNEYFGARKDDSVSLVKNLYDNDSSLSYTRVELKSRLSELTFNGVMTMASGKRYTATDVEAKKFKGTITEIFEMTGTGNPNDIFKILKWIDFQGYEKKMMQLQKRSDAFLQSLVDGIRKEEKTTTTEGKNSKTLIGSMLALQESEPEYYTDDLIKGLISTALLAGTDSSASTIEWAMSLLLNHPEVLEKARVEIEEIVGHDRLVEEADLSKLPYLQSVMNETLRLFPAGPLLIPHVSSEDCNVGGFKIPSGTMLIANIWAVHRDPNLWDDATSFKPERFMGAKIEGYKFAPFGVGRRQCPGGGLANRVVNLFLAVLIQCFEWKRVNEELVDLSEGEGLTMPKKKALEAMRKPRKQMIDVLSRL